MRAAVLNGIGEALRIETAPDPVAGPGEAVVRIQAAALNHRDVWIRKGKYAGLKFPIILGSDGAGVVESVGSGVATSWVGQEVVINPSLGWGDSEDTQDKASFRVLGLPDDGTFAELIKIPAENLYEKPAYLNMEQAASLPLAALTAYRALVHRGGLTSEDTVLVTGAGGGVACFAVQIAAASRAKVYVTSGSEEKIEQAKQLGASGGANYRSEKWDADLKAAAGGFDLIIDSAGGEGFGKLIELVNPAGRIVSYGATAGNPPGLDMRRVFWKQASICGTFMGSPTDFGAMLMFFEQLEIQPLIDKVFPLEGVNDALDHMEKGAQMGKIVLKI